VGKLKKFVEIWKKEGPAYAVKKVARRVTYRMTADYRVETRRKKLSSSLNALFDSTVAYGPFKGLKLPAESWWGTDRAAMVFGLYEQEILTSLANLPPQYKTFIDLGAAEGYYGVGVLVNNLFQRSYCFEQSPKGRKIIASSAEMNRVSERVSIHGIADRNFYNLIPLEARSGSVLLVDIEGGEFDLFDQELFGAFKDSTIFIELHQWIVGDGDNKLAKLRDDASKYFEITEITTTSRDLSVFSELKHFSDTDRWLICSEGRPLLMTWYKLTPIRRITQTAPNF